MVTTDHQVVLDRVLSADCLELELGDFGIENGPRFGPERRTSQSCEAYCVRRWILWMASNNRLNYPLSLLQREAPDFEINEGKQTYYLEFTEACPHEDAWEMSKLEKEGYEDPDTNFLLLGSRGGSGAGGYSGYQAEEETIEEIQHRIHEKSKKAYASEKVTDLLIHPNGNARMVMTQDESFEYVGSRLTIQHPFRRIFLYWDAARIVEVKN